MNQESINVKEALADVALFRKALTGTDQDLNESRLVGITLKANFLIQGGIFFLVGVIFIFEMVSGFLLTQTLMSGGQIPELRHTGIALIGLIVGGLVFTLYFVVWRAAKHNGDKVGTYILRNFRYLNHLSFISDLLIKFMVISLILLAGRPEWITPVLVAFIADYLLQNRLFTLKASLSVPLGLICMGVSLVFFFSQVVSLILPLLIFIVVNGMSLFRLMKLHQTLRLANMES